MRRLLDVGVDARQLVVEQLVVIAELQELRVGELDNLERGLRAGGSIVHEGRVPRRDDEIVREVRDPMAEYLVPLLAAERGALAPQHRCDDVAMMLHDLLGRMRTAQIVDGKHQIVLGQRGLPRIGHRVLETFGDAAARLLGLPFERFVFDELIGRVRKLGPGAVELARQPQRDDAVVEHLEAGTETVDDRDVNAGAVELQRRLLISDVGGCGRFRRERRADAAADRRSRSLEVDRFSDVEQIERDDLPMQRFHGLQNTLVDWKIGGLEDC